MVSRDHKVANLWTLKANLQLVKSVRTLNKAQTRISLK